MASRSVDRVDVLPPSQVIKKNPCGGSNTRTNEPHHPVQNSRRLVFLSPDLYRLQIFEHPYTNKLVVVCVMLLSTHHIPPMVEQAMISTAQRRFSQALVNIWGSRASRHNHLQIILSQHSFAKYTKTTPKELRVLSIAWSSRVHKSCVAGHPHQSLETPHSAHDSTPRPRERNPRQLSK